MAYDEITLKDGKTYALDRYGWVPSVLHWDGWGTQDMTVGKTVWDGATRWLVKRVEPEQNYVGLQPLCATVPATTYFQPPIDLEDES